MLVFQKTGEDEFDRRNQDRFWREFLTEIFLRRVQDALLCLLHKFQPFIYGKCDPLTGKDQFDVPEITIESSLISSYTWSQYSIAAFSRPLLSDNLSFNRSAECQPNASYPFLHCQTLGGLLTIS